MEKVSVAVRVRPARSNEENFDGTFWKVEDNRISLHKSLGTPISGVSYTFGIPYFLVSLRLAYICMWNWSVDLIRFVWYLADHVFDQDCSNARVYDLLTKDVIHAALEGFNGMLIVLFRLVSELLSAFALETIVFVAASILVQFDLVNLIVLLEGNIFWGLSEDWQLNST